MATFTKREVIHKARYDTLQNLKTGLFGLGAAATGNIDITNISPRPVHVVATTPDDLYQRISISSLGSEHVELPEGDHRELKLENIIKPANAEDLKGFVGLIVNSDGLVTHDEYRQVDADGNRVFDFPGDYRVVLPGTTDTIGFEIRNPIPDYTIQPGETVRMKPVATETAIAIWAESTAYLPVKVTP